MNLLRLLLGLIGIELRQGARRAVRRAGEAIFPPEDPPMPLPYSEVARQQEQIRRATTILPPKR